MNKFGSRSKKNIATCHDDWKLILDTSIKTCRVDYGIHCGGRTFKEQLKEFLKGASTLDPRIPKQLARAMHVLTDEHPKSRAIDFHIAEKHMTESLTWNNYHLVYVASHIIATAEMLYAQGLITHKVRWGGNWDMDGVILLDQRFDDNCHLELYIP